jgi:hypothetical protein
MSSELVDNKTGTCQGLLMLSDCWCIAAVGESEQDWIYCAEFRRTCVAPSAVRFCHLCPCSILMLALVLVLAPVLTTDCFNLRPGRNGLGIGCGACSLLVEASMRHELPQATAERQCVISASK